MTEQNQTTGERIVSGVLADCFTEKQISLVERLSNSSHLQDVAVEFVDANVNNPRIMLKAKVRQKWNHVDDFVSALVDEGNRYPTKAEELANGYSLTYNLATREEIDQIIVLDCYKKRIDKRFPYALGPW